MRFFNSALIAGAALLTFAACTDSKKSADSNVNTNIPVDFHTYTYDLVGINKSDSVTTDSLKYWHLTGDCVIPSKIGNNDISALRDSLMTLAHIEISSSNSAVPKGLEGIEICNLNPAKTNTASNAVNSLSIDLLTSSVIVWENYSYEYRVYMAHGVSGINYVNYSIADNKILSLSDLMKPGYEKPLLSLIKNEVKAQNVNLLEPVEELTLPSIFRIRATSIEFIYPSMEIAPYSEGDIRIKLSVMDLADLLTRKGTQLILGTQSE